MAAPETQFDVIEASAQMIALARKRIGDSDRIRFFCQDALDASFPAPQYDGVVTFFFLDCFSETELQQLLNRIAPKLLPGAIWLVSEFTIPGRSWRRWHARAWIWAMYRFFRIATGLRARELPSIDGLLSRLGMHRTDFQLRSWGMIASEVLVYQLDAIGPSTPTEPITTSTGWERPVRR